MTPADQALYRVKQFEALHEAFYEFFIKSLAADASKFNRYRLQLLTVYWEDIALTKAVYPIFDSMSCTLAEKQAVARAALYDALVAHTFGTHLAASDKMLHDRLERLEKVYQDISVHQAAKIDALEKKVNVVAVKEPKANAIPKGQPVLEGTKSGSKK